MTDQLDDTFSARNSLNVVENTRKNWKKFILNIDIFFLKKSIKMADTSADYEVEKIVAKRVKGVEVRNNVVNLNIYFYLLWF